MAATVAKSWNALADILGVSRRTVTNWRKLPGAPKTRDAEAWGAFVEERDLGAERSSATIKKYRAEKLALEIRILRIRAERESRELIPLAEAQGTLDRFVAKVHSLITQKLETEGPPRLVGKDISGIRAELRNLHDEIGEAINHEEPAATAELQSA